jgi:signal peptidase I
MGFIYWLTSRTARRATDVCRHVEKILNAQRDLVKAEGVDAVASAIRAVRAAVGAQSGRPAIEQSLQQLEEAANRWLRPYPHASLRENIEVLLVAIGVALAIRTFFLQPFKIPTGSMQPTLFGVTSVNLKERPDFKIPTGWARVREWLAGVSYVHFVADRDGELEAVEPPRRLLIVNLWQRIRFAGQWHTLWFPPDCGNESLESRARVVLGQHFQKGQTVFNVRVVSGDHLFVDRLTYNFRPPRRGEIIVFETKGIPESARAPFGIPADQFYIKRLVALGGETVSLGDDRHLRINGQRLDASTPHFENLYTFQGDPRDSQFSGHANGRHVGARLAPFFPTERDTYQVPERHYMAMGDNTMNSLDSRCWGDFPQEYVIGKAFFVYWPITARFGWAVR